MSMIPKSRVLEGGYYTLAGVDLNARTSVSDFSGDTVDCRGLTELSFTVQWTADSGGTRAGTFSIQHTDDPRAISDPANAAWLAHTFLSGDAEGDATESGSTATIANTAGKEIFTLPNRIPSFSRLVWDNTTAGTDGAITVWVHGKP